MGGTLIASVAMAQAQAPVRPDQVPTPRDADGHPILSAMWTGTAPGAGGGGNIARTPDAIDFQSRDGTFYGFEEDGRLNRHNSLNKPQYKPEYWDIVQDNDYWANWRDPAYYCVPYGVPRMGAPNQILQIAGQPMIDMVYSKTFYTFNVHRLVWTDGRPHNPEVVAAETYLGDGVGHWEGDTLVIETIGFTDNTWLGADGWIHGFNMKVTERLTRKGNTLLWEATVEDPDYLTRPWVMPSTTLYVDSNPDAYLPEAYPCDSRIQEPWGTEDNPKGWHVH
jgi:hypothetical protein